MWIKNKMTIISLCVLLGMLWSFTSNTKIQWAGDFKKMKLLGVPDTSTIRYYRNKKPTKEELDLGKALFFEKALSRNKNMSCATCHIPTKGLGNGQKITTGTHGDTLGRNVPHIYNLAWNSVFFWDGRSNTLEQQLEVVIQSPEEMDMDFDSIIVRLNAIPTYEKAFKKLFPKKGLTKKTFSRVVTNFERQLVSFNSPFDKYYHGDSTALTNQQVRGLKLFLGKANCIECHEGANFTNNEFHNVGVITDDEGRSVIDRISMQKEFDMTPYPFFASFKAFKTPSLRNVALTAPYFHNGSKDNLKDVLSLYNKGGENPDKTGLAKEIKPLGLTDEEIDDVIAFLHALTDEVKLDSTTAY